MVAGPHEHRGAERLFDKTQVPLLPLVHRAHMRRARGRDANRFDFDRTRFTEEMQQWRRRTAVQLRSAGSMRPGAPN